MSEGVSHDATLARGSDGPRHWGRACRTGGRIPFHIKKADTTTPCASAP
ncbi:hypothetical protein UO65_1667 [Actinokineospora spheciospongiae]|uniref:Uncharacterized protein n=1 Tax=Actinokineospora spheciospongiae TaxID=909613 RepID=W7IQ64_9PSEU|nr:hypothetical protein UO65_1667 [Actinokineospora spheciospongiae]